MKLKTVFFLLNCFFVFSLVSNFAFAKQSRIESKPVENKQSWQESFDLNSKKSGKYNIFVTATDLGGNTAIEGPYNLYIDPNSDLPVCGITNPLPRMRIVGNLNIVGTCVDDDGVEQIELILDGDEEHPVKANGKEFWSYYLDTNKLEEGPHTIKVVGTDINGLRGNPVELTWNLDRRQPLTAVTNLGMGELVSGKIKFKGTVQDGNGIKKLEYSLDGGETFKEARLSVKKENVEFDIPVDTKKFEDGPQVIWFKSQDKLGSVGIYSFLYFVDNTKPEIKIIKPELRTPQFGKLTIAGYAKDAIGITKLEWQFGKEAGEFELTPGNPYWAQTFDLAGATEKSRKFIITATDIAGNIRTVTQDIPINEELDKPLVTIQFPTKETLLTESDYVYVRGIATDSDGIKSVKYRLDNGDWIEEETKGVFYAKLSDAGSMVTGTHSVTVIATDRHDVQSNPVTVSFSALGNAPNFSEAKIDGETVINGMSVHPEAGKTFSVIANSSLGLQNVHVETTWGTDGKKEIDYNLNGSTSQVVTIPLNDTVPMGVYKITIKATDKVDRTTEYTCILDIKNITELQSPTTEIIFSDSNIAESGKIIGNHEFPVSGYLVGGKARSVELVPRTRFANVQLDDNSIVITPTEVEGVSETFIVRVTTDKGVVCDSRKLFIINGYSAPVVKIKNTDGRNALNIVDGVAEVSGTVNTSGTLESLYYKVYGAKATLTNGILTGVTAISDAEAKENPLPLDKTFSFTENFGYGMFVIEVTAINNAGLRSSEAIAFRNIPNFPRDAKGSPKAPVITWIDSEEVYYVASYQGTLSRNFGYFRRHSMAEGNTSVEAKVTYGEKVATSNLKVSKSKNININFATVDDKSYASGKTIILDKGETKKLVAYVETVLPGISANYEITGDKIPGGDERQTGNATVEKADGNRFKVTIPLSNLPVRMNKIKLTVKSGSIVNSLTGSIGVVRSEKPDTIFDREGVYVGVRSGTYFDEDSASYVMKAGDVIDFYPNIKGLKWSAELVSDSAGLEFSYNETAASIKAVKEGIYSNVSVRFKAVNNISYSARPIKMIVDSGEPTVNISAPALHAWVKNSLRITGTATDPSGIKYGEYSVDNGETWKPLSLTLSDRSGIGATFSATEYIRSLEDGLICLDVRVSDIAGHVAYTHTSAFKDTTPPSVEVVLPSDDEVVNGENLVVFNVTDNGSFERSFYIAPPTSGTSKERKALDVDLTTVMTHVGTHDKPIDESMSFEFVDDAGNVAVIESWQFIIDAQSDLPITEIHLPTENEVITRDFTISGLVYDDDGDSTIYYRIDNGAYIKYPEAGTSFAIDIPFSTMVDNEHTIYAYAVDINGVKGPVIERKFRVSTEEPKGAVESPTIDKSNKESVTISGVSSDKNGIEKVLISLDNGNSYNNTVGTEQWSYTFDSRAIPNGTNVVFIKVFDKYGIEGLYSSLINIDNESPEMILDYPLEYSTTAGPLFFSGYAFDNVDITDLYVTIRSLEGKAVPRNMQRINFSKERIISENIDLSSLDNGVYNIELTALDKAMNATHVSRNIELNKNKPLAVVNLLYPLNGEHKQGNFNIYGSTVADKKIQKVSLYIDDAMIEETEITASEYFMFKMTPEKISEGIHRYRVDATIEDGSVIRSKVQTVEYRPTGPWITIDNFTYGDFAIGRPYIQGAAGYSLDDDETLISKMKMSKVSKEQKAIIEDKKAAIALKKVEKIEISFDNGKSFNNVSKGEKWMYRIENEDLPEGYHFMLVRATMRTGEVAIERTIIQIDNTKPRIRLITPSIGGRYNQEMLFSGLTSDEIGLQDVTLTLRKGDKAAYEVPSFIQGLYLDWHFWGATLFDIGVGLTFFDDVVKVQFQWGQFTQDQRDIFSKSSMRYGGNNVMGIKILANIANIPFSYFFGRDWEWLSSTVSVGAQFTRFNETGSGEAQILSALLAQLEFPKIKFAKMKMFSSFSAYTEFSLWFIPTDVQSEDVDIEKFVPQIAEGIRISVF